MKLHISSPDHTCFISALVILVTHVFACMGQPMVEQTSGSSEGAPSTLASDLLRMGEAQKLLLNDEVLDQDLLKLNLPEQNEIQHFKNNNVDDKNVASSKRWGGVGSGLLSRWSNRLDDWVNPAQDHKRWVGLTPWRNRALTNNNEIDKKWAKFNSWGKRDSLSSPSKQWGENAVLGKQSDAELEKKWKEMAVWGKREMEMPDKKWKEMAVWGKRNNMESPDKKWKEMAVWGKRDNMEIPDKKWKEMAVWGKRDDMEIPDKKWKEMAVWGKRDNMDVPDKKWKEMAVWGKRDDMEIPDKKWKEMAVWGKRDNMDVPDKKWKEMAVWGKRDNMEIPDKKWKEMAVWGKRSSDLPEKKWKEMSVWGKRNIGIPDKKWKEMAVWGKRSTYSDLVKKWKNNFAVWGKKRSRLIDNLDTNPDDGNINSANSAVRVSRRNDSTKRYKVPTHKWRPRSRELWGKRPSWSRTGFTSWGKRSSPSISDQEEQRRQQIFKAQLQKIGEYILNDDSSRHEQENDGNAGTVTETHQSLSAETSSA